MEGTADETTPKPRRGLLAFVPVLIFVGLATAFVFALRAGDPSKLPSALVGKPVPAFTLSALAGLKGRDGSSLPGLDATDLAKGEVTVVNVWASWCGPCREEHPVLMELGAEEGIRLVGINYKDKTENARRFLGSLGNPYAAVGVDEAGRTAINWGVYGVPETFVIDGKGVIRLKHVGPLTDKAVMERLRPAIAEAAKDGS